MLGEAAVESLTSTSGFIQKPAKTDLTWTNNEPEKNAGPNAGDIVGLTYYKRRFAPNRCL
jgi:hypothetical protein